MERFIKITSKDNDIIKRISDLQSSAKKRKEEGIFVLEGQRLCCDALINGFDIMALAVSETAMERLESDCHKLAEIAQASYILSDRIFEKISDTVTPQGIICLCKIPNFDLNKIDKKGKYIALENLQDPSNLGAISRTAEALGINGIIISGGCDPYSSKSLRASMGALLRLPVIRVSDILDFSKSYGFTTYASVVDKTADKINDMRILEGSIVLIGNEGNGLDALTIERCDKTFTIPMSGNAESLNAAVAASIIMWEMCKC